MVVNALNKYYEIDIVKPNFLIFVEKKNTSVLEKKMCSSGVGLSIKNNILRKVKSSKPMLCLNKAESIKLPKAKGLPSITKKILLTCSFHSCSYYHALLYCKTLFYYLKLLNAKALNC